MRKLYLLRSLYTPTFLKIFDKILSDMFIIFQPVLGFLIFHYQTHGVNKIRSPGVKVR